MADHPQRTEGAAPARLARGVAADRQLLFGEVRPDPQPGGSRGDCESRQADAPPVGLPGVLSRGRVPRPTASISHAPLRSGGGAMKLIERQPVEGTDPQVYIGKREY